MILLKRRIDAVYYFLNFGSESIIRTLSVVKRKKSNAPNYNFRRTGKSAYESGHTDLNAENISFLRDKYVTERLRSPLEDSLSKELLKPMEHTWKEMRCGAVGVKLGSYPLFYKEDGRRTLATLVQLIDTQVVDVTTSVNPNKFPLVKRNLDKSMGYCRITVGCKNISPEWLSQKQMEIYNKHGVPCKERLESFVCTKDSFLPPGTLIQAAHFVPGQLLTVWGRSMDRGFQGPMKRWNFRGMPATHGTTKSRRAHGSLASTGQRRVLPGRRMAGQMGDKVVSVANVKLLRINTKYNVLFIEGFLPGLDGNFISMRDAKFSKAFAKTGIESLPFPTYSSSFHEPIDEDLFSSEIHQFDEDSIDYRKSD